LRWLEPSASAVRPIQARISEGLECGAEPMLETAEPGWRLGGLGRHAPLRFTVGKAQLRFHNRRAEYRERRHEFGPGRLSDRAMTSSAPGWLRPSRLAPAPSPRSHPSRTKQTPTRIMSAPANWHYVQKQILYALPLPHPDHSGCVSRADRPSLSYADWAMQALANPPCWQGLPTTGGWSTVSRRSEWTMGRGW
jgi:hypothetical protein